LKSYGQELVVKPSYVPFLGRGFKSFLLAVILLVAKSITSSLPGLVSLAVTVATVLFLLIGVVAFIIGAVRRNSYIYVLGDEGVPISRQLFSSYTRRIPYAAISDVQIFQSLVGRIFNYGDIVPITKSGFGLTAEERYAPEAYVTEMTDTPNPKEVADLISSRISSRTTARGQTLAD
jgi:uncharacterized membrane protein YdbT with pleckstrin-like domain